MFAVRQADPLGGAVLSALRIVDSPWLTHLARATRAHSAAGDALGASGFAA